MADITIGVRQGDTSGVDLLKEVGDEVGRSAVKWQELAGAVKAAAKMVFDFTRDAVKAYADSERVQRQLVRAAGEYADALGEQAEALSKLYAVDDDVIKQSQVLLTQWGGAGAAAEDVTKAVLDYAAAMGVDATSATQDLIRNVESGGVGLAKLGVHFEATGDKGHDLAAAIEAISKKFGGAAAADAGSLIGQTHAAELAFEDFKKALGGGIGEMIRASGVLPKLTAEIRALTDSLFTPTAQKQEESKDFIAQQVKYWEDIAAGNVIGYKDFATKTQFTFEEAQAELAKWRAKLRPSDFNASFAGGGGLPAVTGTTNKGMRDAGPAISLKGDYIQEETKEVSDAMAAQSALLEEQLRKELQGLEEQRIASQEETAKNLKAALDGEEKAYVESWKQVARLDEERRRAREEASRQEAETAGRMGDAIGAAFVNGLASQIEKLSTGGEIDVGMMVGDILASVIGIAATAIGTAYGAPQLGAAIGNLAAIGIRAGAGAISRGNLAKNRARKYHEGGWVGDEISHLPRYHSGAWIGADEQRAILQTGERVLSRREVGAMGGPAGVDAAARGGGRAVVINLTAIDSKTASESLQTDLGKGMRTALRTGRGDLPLLFAGLKGPR